MQDNASKEYNLMILYSWKCKGYFTALQGFASFCFVVVGIKQV
jgi:hypothetical protein